MNLGEAVDVIEEVAARASQLVSPRLDNDRMQRKAQRGHLRGGSRKKTQPFTPTASVATPMRQFTTHTAEDHGQIEEQQRHRSD